MLVSLPYLIAQSMIMDYLKWSCVLRQFYYKQKYSYFMEISNLIATDNKNESHEKASNLKLNKNGYRHIFFLLHSYPATDRILPTP